MSETKHTPGPWRECGHDRNGCVCRQIWGTSVDMIVCVASPPIGTSDLMPVPTPEQEAANARLIAAAPDLLAALKFLVDAADTEPGMSIYKAHIEKAKSSIAKAEGASLPGAKGE